MKLIIVLLALFLSFGTITALARSFPAEEPKNLQMNRRERESGEKFCKAAIKSKKEECRSLSAGQEKKRCKAEVVDLKEHCKSGAEEPKKQKCKPLPVGSGGPSPQVQENGCPYE
ncbi:hypothetical protein IE81DRAFT_349613 [Ceraceosorus guamensis]|uniref:Uncharacterized protein n=1 Tax=Ceraceosorus guamensis TaxID=1522189 RepID=A0A316VR36_9BASI|nr:hypothetical protein IE81DRAFT_349613 [Ceraceosorus guamensis]PWN40056.1 hypothetical protein IE81DRAFT_349613 [Ceraceosorus guamensis]